MKLIYNNKVWFHLKSYKMKLNINCICIWWLETSHTPIKVSPFFPRYTWQWLLGKHHKAHNLKGKMEFRMHVPFVITEHKQSRLVNCFESWPFFQTMIKINFNHQWMLKIDYQLLKKPTKQWPKSISIARSMV